MLELVMLEIAVFMSPLVKFFEFSLAHFQVRIFSCKFLIPLLSICSTNANWQILKEADLKCAIAAVFNIADKNDDDFLTRDEVNPLIEALYDIHDVNDAAKKADELIAKADKNKDNKLSKKELIDAVMTDEELKKAFTKVF